MRVDPALPVGRAASDADVKPGRPDPVVVVHGTFANPAVRPRAGPFWWEPGGSFCTRLDESLARLNVNARCWAGLEQRPFRWSGENLEVARRAAARELEAYLARLEDDPSVRRYHVVAHSHGGQVVRLGLRAAATPKTKLGGVVYLGTPFLHFGAEPEEPGRLGRINWFYVLIVGGLVFAAWWVSNIFWLLVAIVLIKSIVDYDDEQQPFQRYERAGPSFTLPQDEAVALLRHAAPLRSVGSGPRSRARPPRRGIWGRSWAGWSLASRRPRSRTSSVRSAAAAQGMSPEPCPPLPRAWSGEASARSAVAFARRRKP